MKNEDEKIMSFNAKCLGARQGLANDDIDAAFFVLKKDGTSMKIGMRDTDALKRLVEIEKDDGIHVAWEEFDSIAAIDEFLAERRQAFEYSKSESDGSYLPHPG